MLSATENVALHEALLTERLKQQGAGSSTGGSTAAAPPARKARLEQRERFTLFVGNVSFGRFRKGDGTIVKYVTRR